MSAIGLGHDLGLFRVFYDTDQPLSLLEIATKSNLKERFVCDTMHVFCKRIKQVNRSNDTVNSFNKVFRLRKLHL